MKKWVVCLVVGLALLAFGAGVGVNSWGRWALLGGGVLLTGLAAWGIVKTRRGNTYLGPGYHPGQSEPRLPGQPVGQYMEGMTPLPPHVPQNHPGYQPPEQHGYPGNLPQQPFGPGSQ